MDLQFVSTCNDIIVDEKYFKIFGIDDKLDKIRAGYNIGDLLNMPSLGGYWKRNPHNTVEDLHRMHYIANLYKDSILSYYCEHRPHDELIPCNDRIIKAVEKFIKSFSDEHLQRIFDCVSNDDVLCVHVRCGDKEIEKDYIDCIKKLSQKYKQVYILSGLHIDERFASNHLKKERFLNIMNHLLRVSNISLIVASPDVHISIMRKATNLLIHKGGFSAIGMLVNKNNIFITKYFDLFNSNSKQLVEEKCHFIDC